VSSSEDMDPETVATEVRFQSPEVLFSDGGRLRAVFQIVTAGELNFSRVRRAARLPRLASSTRAGAQLSGEIPDLAVLGRDPGARERPSSMAFGENGPRHGLTRAAPGAGPLAAAFRARAGGSADEAGNNALDRGLWISAPRALARPRLDRAHELGRLRTLGRRAGPEPAPVARAQLSRELLAPARLRTLGRRGPAVAFAAAGGAAAAPFSAGVGIRRGRPARAGRFTQALHARAFRAAQLRARDLPGGAPPAQLLVRARTAGLAALARPFYDYSAGTAMEFFRTPLLYGRRAEGAAGGGLFYLTRARRGGNGGHGRELGLRLAVDGRPRAAFGGAGRRASGAREALGLASRTARAATARPARLGAPRHGAAHVVRRSRFSFKNGGHPSYA